MGSAGVSIREVIEAAELSDDSKSLTGSAVFNGSAACECAEFARGLTEEVGEVAVLTGTR